MIAKCVVATEWSFRLIHPTQGSSLGRWKQSVARAVCKADTRLLASRGPQYNAGADFGTGAASFDEGEKPCCRRRRKSTGWSDEIHVHLRRCKMHLHAPHRILSAEKFAQGQTGRRVRNRLFGGPPNQPGRWAGSGAGYGAGCCSVRWLPAERPVLPRSTSTEQQWQQWQHWLQWLQWQQ